MNPYWRNEERDLTIYNADCLDVMREFSGRDEQFQLCLTDPPYNRDMAYKGRCNDSLTRREYKRWSRTWFVLARSVAATTVFTCGMQNIGMWERIEQPTWWLAWDTVNRLMKRTPLGYNRWEPVAVYGTTPQLIPDIFHVPITSETNPADHPCPKPLAWAQWLVSRFSKVGWRVLDPFMGTGPVGLACMTLGRSFVGIDSCEAYCEAAAQRIETALEQLPLFWEPVNEARQEALALGEVID